MKKIIAVLFVAVATVATVLAFDNKTKKAAPAAKESAAAEGEVHWMSIDEAQVAMKKKPKKIYMDVYTDWCGWCKKMDKSTFSNPAVVKYLNDNFYAVRLNAEQKEPIRFLGKMYEFKEDMRANEFAVNMLQGRMSYPTSVVIEENFQNPQPIPGYLDVPTIEMVLKYLNEGHYKNTPFDQWQKEFKATWQ